jgi:hypothetical protein
MAEDNAGWAVLIGTVAGLIVILAKILGVF